TKSLSAIRFGICGLLRFVVVGVAFDHADLPAGFGAAFEAGVEVGVERVAGFVLLEPGERLVPRHWSTWTRHSHPRRDCPVGVSVTYCLIPVTPSSTTPQSLTAPPRVWSVARASSTPPFGSRNSRRSFWP